MVETLTVAESARRLGWHPNDVRRCIRNEEIPVIRDGRQVRVLADYVRDPQAWRQRHLAAMSNLKDDESKAVS